MENEALKTLMLNLKHYDWNTQTHFKFDENEGKRILKELEKLFEKEK